MPLAHAVAAQVESLPLDEFVTSPQKVSNGLVALREILQTDALTVACGAGIELEALGAQTRWASGMPVMHGKIDPHALAGDGLEARLAAGQRFSVALEATRRLTGTRGEPLLVAGVTGPYALSFELQRLGAFGDGDAGGAAAGDAAALEIAGRIALETARLFLTAGCSAVVVVESALTAAPPNWSAAIATIAKLARFYDALPLVAFASDALPALPAAAIACPVAGLAPNNGVAGPAPGNAGTGLAPHNALADPAPNNAAVGPAPQNAAVGSAPQNAAAGPALQYAAARPVPQDAAPGPAGIALLPDERTWQPPATMPNVLTTCGDIRFDTAIDELRRACAALNATPLNA